MLLLLNLLLVPPFLLALLLCYLSVTHRERHTQGHAAQQRSD